jgi:phosphonate utilization associated putative membrane protein
MGLSSGLLALVLLGALLHASWNLLIKSSADKALDTALVHALAAALAWPLALWVGPPAAAAWPFIAASLLIHIAYYAALVGAYKHGDLNLAYPIMRGSAPLLVALVSAPVLGESLSAIAWLGVLGVAAGVLLMGASALGSAVQQHKALGFALANAAVIATYTLVDGQGVRQSGNAWAYAFWLMALDGFAFPLLLAWRRGAAGRAAARPVLAQRWRLALLGAAASLGSYSIALWAMARAPVATVAALREVSVLFAALLATWLLKEPFGPARAAGTLAIVAGVVALRLG